FRPRFPTIVPFTKQAGCKKPLGEKRDATATSPQPFTPVPGATITGRSVPELRSKLRSMLVMMLNGRPEFRSMIGASDQLLKSLPTKPLPSTLPDCSTPLKTKRWRWSKSELERSAFGSKLFCGASGDCKSVESSIACDHVYEARNS